MAGSFYADRYHHPGYHMNPIGYPRTTYTHPRFCYDPNCTNRSCRDAYNQDYIHYGNSNSAFSSSPVVRHQRNSNPLNCRPTKSNNNFHTPRDPAAGFSNHHLGSSVPENYADSNDTTAAYPCFHNGVSR